YAGRHDRPRTDTVQCAWNEPTEVAEAVISGWLLPKFSPFTPTTIRLPELTLG
ncbi:unnamed protein product, partial [Effrenium voratum]